MKQSGYAFFVRTPRTIRDLRRPHLPQSERRYEVVHIVQLDALDYENFTEDLLADRQFIEDFGSLCSEADCFRCLLVMERHQKEGLLVMPEMESYVKWAAYIGWDQQSD